MTAATIGSIPARGMEMELKLKPFAGYYEGRVQRFCGHLFGCRLLCAPWPQNDGKIDDTIVLAARVEGGGMPGASSLRKHTGQFALFYRRRWLRARLFISGHRPKGDKDGDPLGGRSYQVVNLEGALHGGRKCGHSPLS